MASRDFAVRRGRVHADAGVDRDHAGGIAEQRVDVDLADLGVVATIRLNCIKHIDDAVDVGGRAVAVTFEQLGDARALDLRARKRGIERRQFERLVADDLDRGAAMAEQDHRTESGVGRNAGDQLVGADAVDHLLHDEAFELAPWAARATASRSSGGRRLSTSPGVARFKATPPTSDLWMMSRERIFSATGALMRAAAAAADVASATASVRAKGMP